MMAQPEGSDRLDVKAILLLVTKLVSFVGPIRAWRENRKRKQQQAELAAEANIGLEKRIRHTAEAETGQRSYIVGRVGAEPLSKTAYETLVCYVFLQNKIRPNDFLVTVDEIVDTVRMHPVTVTSIDVPPGRLGKVSMRLGGGGAGLQELRIRARTHEHERFEAIVPLVVERSRWPAGGRLEKTPIRGL